MALSQQQRLFVGGGIVTPDDVMSMAKEAGFETQGSPQLLLKLEKFANLVLYSRQPISDEHLKDIIEYESKRTGWRIPPTIQVARAVEQWHGIEK
jgi:hypothetical protein